MNTQELEQKVGAKDMTPVSSTVGNGNEKGMDLLQLMESVFFTPMLSLLLQYLSKSNGTKKTNENCILEFRHSHSQVFKLFFFVDFIFRLIYMSIVFIVVVRGLGIWEYLKIIL